MSMTLHISRVSGLAALLIGPLFSSLAAAQLAVSANDAKAVLVNGVNTVPPNPADDTVTIIDLGVSPPKVIGELKAPSSVVGPPQNVAIARIELHVGGYERHFRPTARWRWCRATAITRFPFYP